MKTALITGISGQDGAYLAKLLLLKGYHVVGVKRRTSILASSRIDPIYDNPNFRMEYGNLHDAACFWSLLMKYAPDEIYNLAAQSHVATSFAVPEETVDSIAMGTLRLLNAYKQICSKARFYQASSSEMYGDSLDLPYDENSKMIPASPYACAKLFAHNLVGNYRRSYGLHASSGILFNHESPYRGETFVTRKITMGAARIKLGLQKKIRLGNLAAKRDWGFAEDYVKAMWLMLQQEVPEDYVIATGQAYTVQEFLQCVFDYAGLGDAEKYLAIDPNYFRPDDPPCLVGNATKAKQQLDWKPNIEFEQLAVMMFDADLEMLS